MKTIFIIICIIGIVIGTIYFIKNKYEEEELKTIKTDMLLIEGKIKIIAEKVRIKEKNATFIGKKINELEENDEIQSLEEKKVIDLNEKNNQYYILEKAHLEELGLSSIELKEGFYIVDYNNSEVIYSKGIADEEGNVRYKLSELIK